MTSIEKLNQNTDKLLERVCKILNRSIRQEMKNKKRIQAIEKQIGFK